MRLGVDIGGTFTDIVLVDDGGAVFSWKLLSTPGDYSEAIETGVNALLAKLAVAPETVTELVHATTVATNTIIERRGVRVGLVTTRGFRDVLELGRFRAPRLYDLSFRRPEPLVPRELRFEVEGRIDAQGRVVTALDEAGLHAIAEVLARERVDAVAICFINSHASDTHERAAEAILAHALPGVAITRSTALLPQIGEYERTSTTVVNAYIRPVVGRYVETLAGRLARMRITAPLMIMQSSGGIAPGELVADRPITIIESGPAAGVLGGQRLAARLGLGDVIVFDMGGTTAKATIVEGGAFGLCPETEVGGGAALGSRIIRGAGYPVQAPTIDIAEVGAGGGSIAVADEAGGLRVGPRSAGAEPGPVCYARGGTQPTVTDANLLLGYINPEALVGGDLALDAEAARSVVATLGRAIGLDPTDTAYGIHRIANASMLRALRGVSSERGRDPAQFALLAIGGNGPVHATSLAEAAGMTRILVPPVAGLFSALGMLFADVEHHLVTGYYRRVDGLDTADLNRVLGELVGEGRAMLAREGFGRAERQAVDALVDLKYVGQTAPLTVQLAGFPVDDAVLAAMRVSFAQAHQRTFGYVSPKEPLQLVALKAVCRGVPERPRMPERIVCDRASRGRPRVRSAFFGREHGWMDTSVLARSEIGGSPRPGPLIVEEYDTTVVVRPGWQAWVDDWNVLHMTRDPGREGAKP